DEAVRLYQRAIALDSGFAAAWSRIALVEANAYFAGSIEPQRVALAKRAVERVRALAPGRPETYLTEGTYDATIVGEQQQALAEFEQGLRLAPSNALLL